MSGRWALAALLTAPPRELRDVVVDPDSAGRSRVCASVYGSPAVVQVLGETRVEHPDGDLDSILLAGGEERLDGADLLAYCIEDAAGRRRWSILDAAITASAAVAQQMVEARHARLTVPPEAIL